MKVTPVFSERLLAIEMELDELISGAGGIDGLKFLDRLSSLSKKDQENVLQICLAIVEEYDSSRELNISQEEAPRLRVVSGGKN